MRKDASQPCWALHERACLPHGAPRRCEDAGSGDGHWAAVAVLPVLRHVRQQPLQQHVAEGGERLTSDTRTGFKGWVLGQVHRYLEAKVDQLPCCSILVAGRLSGLQQLGERIACVQRMGFCLAGLQRAQIEAGAENRACGSGEAVWQAHLTWRSFPLLSYTRRQDQGLGSFCPGRPACCAVSSWMKVLVLWDHPGDECLGCEDHSTVCH